MALISYTTHLRPGRDPVLLPEGFSLWAALFGWLWLLFQGALIPAALLFALEAMLGRLLTGSHASLAPALGTAWLLLQGALARDVLRWDLARRGYANGPIVAASSPVMALTRLLDARPDLASLALGNART